jgi:hypothetical protein
MERGGLTCVKFAEVSIKGHSIYASPDPFWELKSTTALPKMSNSVPNPLNLSPFSNQ